MSPSILGVGGPAKSYFETDASVGWPVTCARTGVAWSDTERILNGLSYVPQTVIDRMVTEGVRIFVAQPNNVQATPVNWFQSLALTESGLANAADRMIYVSGGYTTTLHEIGHIIDLVLRLAAGLTRPSNPSTAPAGVTGRVLTACRAYDATVTDSVYAATNEAELVAESYEALMLETRHAATTVTGDGPGVTHGNWLEKVACNGDTALAAEWRTYLQETPVWPATALPAPAITDTEIAAIGTLRGSTVQDLDLTDATKAPFLLLHDYPNGYTTTRPATGTVLTGWRRSDRRHHPTLPFRAGQSLTVEAGHLRHSGTAGAGTELTAAQACAASTTRRVTMTVNLSATGGIRTLYSATGYDAGNDVRSTITITSQTSDTIKATHERKNGAGTVLSTTTVTTGQVDTLLSTWVTIGLSVEANGRLTLGYRAGAATTPTLLAASTVPPSPVTAPTEWRVGILRAASADATLLRAYAVDHASVLDPSSRINALHDRYGGS